MASVAYFDKNESPYSYDPEYNAEKIKKWKEAADITDFFIVQQLSDILPFPRLSEEDFNLCSKVMEEIQQLGMKKA